MCTVLFDLEGTLVQTIEDDRDAIHEFRMKMANKLVTLGIPPKELEGIEASTLMRNKALEIVDKYFERNKIVRFHREMDKFLKSFELCWALQSKMFPETRSVLHKLKKLKVEMGLVTNTSRDAAEHMLSMHKLRSFFKVIVTREDVRRLKPDPEGVLLALKKLDGHSFFFVGDLAHDSFAAKKAGGVSIIVKRNPLKTLGFEADYIVSSLEEVPNIVLSSSKRTLERLPINN
jgi:pyrophosphatase PpaX